MRERSRLARGHHVAVPSRRHPMARRFGFGVAGFLVAVLVVGVAVFVKLEGNITGVDITSGLGQRPDSLATTDPSTNRPPLNILLMGSDTRDGLADAEEFGGTNDLTTGTQHADTTLLVHLAADRRSAFVVSIPRDSMVRRPDCQDPTDSGAQRPLGMFNLAFNEGGPACAVKTVEANTGVFIDHYAVVNFEGFRDMVDALGGVDVCLAEPISDPATGLELPAGTSRLDGTTSTQFVRARKGIGDGSDIGRIDRQQAFLSAVVREATSSGLLLRPDRLVSFLDAATKSLTTDPEIASIRELSELALQVKNMPTEEIRFVTVPIEVYEPDRNRVIWTQAAEELWEAARSDLPLPGTGPSPSASPTATTTTAAPPTVGPDEITVAVVNSTGVSGLARQAGSVLTAQGFVVTEVVNGTPGAVQGAVITYPLDGAEGARTLQAAFPGATLVPDVTLTDSYGVELGPGSPDVAAVPNRTGTEPLPSQTLSATMSPSVSGSVPGPSPTLSARVAADDTCT